MTDTAHDPGDTTSPGVSALGFKSHNLPVELSSFVGREREITEVWGLLAGDARLLTLTGPGGYGKTRLALAVAARVTEDFEDGAWWVGLASLSDPELLPQVAASALGLREQPGVSVSETLADALRQKRMLLVLDNCEHLIEACARFVQTMLLSCPHLRILATSREVLSVAGEANWRVPSLAVPEEGRPVSVEEAGRYEAVGLFVERARSRLSAFSLTSENAPAVTKVCQKLDGIPLAIELAAARVPVLSAEQISKRLENPLKLLTGGSRTMAPRQQTLRATLAWSYDLLSEPEQELLCRLSVFAGGWTLEAVEAVGVVNGIEESDVLDLLSRLVDKSMVLVTEEASGEEGTLRYRMLESVRRYARERLEASKEEADAARGRHAGFFLALAEEAESELMEERQGAWLKRLEREHDNFRAALSWALDPAQPEERAEMVLRLATALGGGGFWVAYGLG